MDVLGEESDSITVFDGPDPTKFSDSQKLSSYMQQYPEAENDQACRLFKYTPKCPPTLLMTVLSTFDFTRFSMFPFGLAGKDSVNVESRNTLPCTCEKCRAGEHCGRQAVQISLAYIMPGWEKFDPDNRLCMTVNPKSFLIHLDSKLVTHSLFFAIAVAKQEQNFSLSECRLELTGLSISISTARTCPICL